MATVRRNVHTAAGRKRAKPPCVSTSPASRVHPVSRSVQESGQAGTGRVGDEDLRRRTGGGVMASSRGGNVKSVDMRE